MSSRAAATLFATLLARITEADCLAEFFCCGEHIGQRSVNKVIHCVGLGLIGDTYGGDSLSERVEHGGGNRARAKGILPIRCSPAPGANLTELIR